MTEVQYILKAIKRHGQLYVLDKSPLHATCQQLQEKARVSMTAERSPVGDLWRVTQYQEASK